VAGLVLLLPFEAARDDAVIVAPVDFHRHVAGAMDLVLAPADSGIDCDLRVALGLEAPVDLADLEFRLASVEPGLVRRIANATVPEDRYGTSPAARQDPWLQLDEPLRSALADLEHSAGARHPLSELWGTFAEVWDPNHVPELVDLFRALPADPSDAVVDLAEVIARRRLHEAARDIAFGRGAVAAGKLRDVTRPAWPVTHDSVPGLAARLEESGSGSLLIVEGLPSDLGGQRVLIVLAQGYRRDCDWWNGLEGVLAPDAEVAGGRVEVVLAKGALRTRDLAGLAVVPAPP
jgi:hypothetical protein